MFNKIRDVTSDIGGPVIWHSSISMILRRKGISYMLIWSYIWCSNPQLNSLIFLLTWNIFQLDSSMRLFNCTLNLLYRLFSLSSSYWVKVFLAVYRWLMTFSIDSMLISLLMSTPSKILVGFPFRLNSYISIIASTVSFMLGRSTSWLHSTHF